MTNARTLAGCFLAGAICLAGTVPAVGIIADGDGRAGGAGEMAAAPGTRANPVKAKAAVRDGYVPRRLVVAPRQTVWFVSVDRLVHTSTSYKVVRGKPVFDNLPSAGLYRIRAPRTAGTYPYYCLVHPYQRGVLVVRAPRRR